MVVLEASTELSVYGVHTAGVRVVTRYGIAAPTFVRQILILVILALILEPGEVIVTVVTCAPSVTVVASVPAAAVLNRVSPLALTYDK